MQPVNLDDILRVDDALRQLNERFAFLGGAVLGLLIHDRAAVPVRPTKDVDVVVSATARAGYTELEGRLRGIGFRHDIREDAPMCRWLLDDITVDIIPTGESALGWKSRWMPEALDQAAPMEVRSGRSIMVVTAPFFLAAKIEAWKNRGNNDFLGSVDLEDIVAVVDGRPAMVDEVTAAPIRLQRYLRREFQAFLSDRRFLDSLPGHLPSDAASQQRIPKLMIRLRALAGIPTKQ